ncbi:MAG: sn-glycerol-3-phosphate ABC transporter substrate-binding protein UgpB [Proteobacteria bacterium]|nr:sn-glycerol-3-phosphate ABC transporter substrate-binding protein UgpB [Pseudomonadota bacterium]
MLHTIRGALLAVATVAGCVPLATGAAAQTEIQFWHAMGGELGEKVSAMANEFNKGQKEYKVVPVFKGTYAETMTGAIAAFRAKQQPHIVQVFEVGTASMMAAKGAVYPVYKLMADTKEPFNPKDYLAAVVGYYTDTDGNMLSFPFNSSTPILYYNKDAFQKAGLDPETPPKTWDDLAAYSKKILASGAAKCGFTTGWPSWVHIENLSALHNVPIATKANGFGGIDIELKINGELQVRHIDNMAKWTKDGTFKYGGRESKAAPMFYSGECAMYMNSSAARAGVDANAKTFKVGVGMLPYYGDVKGAPQNSIIGGATLWVLQGRPAADYIGVSKFLAYLSKPEVQASWHQATGYLPITKAATELTQSQGFYKSHPGTDIPAKQMTLNPPTENSKGLRIGNFVQVRDVIEGELEEAFAGKKSAKEALDSAVKRGNDLIKQFVAANQ